LRRRARESASTGSLAPLYLWRGVAQTRSVKIILCLFIAGLCAVECMAAPALKSVEVSGAQIGDPSLLLGIEKYFAAFVLTEPARKITCQVYLYSNGEAEPQKLELSPAGTTAPITSGTVCLMAARWGKSPGESVDPGFRRCGIQLDVGSGAGPGDSVTFNLPKGIFNMDNAHSSHAFGPTGNAMKCIPLFCIVSGDPGGYAGYAGPWDPAHFFMAHPEARMLVVAIQCE